MNTRIGRFSGLLATALAAGAIAASPASATWGKPINLSKDGQNADQARVATDDNGAVFVWRRPVSGHLIVQAKFRNTLTGALSSVKDISAPGQDAFNPEVAIDTDGDAVITWAGADGTIHVRERAADGTLSAVQTLSASGSDASSSEVGVDGDGDAVFVWRRQLSTATRVQARARSALDGSLTGVQTLSGENGSASEPEVAVDNDGDAVFAWRRSDGTVQRVETVARTFSTGAVQKLSPAGVAGQDAFQPQVEVDVDGDAVFTWRRFDGADSRIQARARTFSTRALSAVQDLSDAGEDALNPEVAVSRVDADPDAVFTWQRFDGTNTRVQARTRSAAGVLGAVQNVSPAGENGFEPRIGVDQDGVAFATWIRDLAIDRAAAAKGP